MKSLRKIFNFYYRYIQPLLGLGLIVMGVFKYFNPTPEICTETFCAISMLSKVEPFGYAVPGLFVLALWLKDVTWEAAEGKDAPRKGRVKPEDFVK